ncbi:Peptidase M2 peptidyl-dipeptidase A [Trinorchestia longiramus]|nr:Peptidase M2 peptidyl-dipeptidase A [Trinorchestia longiramus]
MWSLNSKVTCVVVVVALTIGPSLSQGQDEEEARQFLQGLERRSQKECTKLVEASWNYEADLTPENNRKRAAAQLEKARWDKEQWEQVQGVWGHKWHALRNESLKRQFRHLSILGTAALPEDKLSKFNDLVSNMKTIYSTAKICDYSDFINCDLRLEPDLTRVMMKSRDYDELKHVWEEWRLSSGALMKEDYKRFVNLANDAAQLNGFDNMGEMWLYPYESATFKDDMKKLWQQLRPLYEQLHAYVRRKLRETYGEDKVSKRGAIPAHLLGNMWAQSWSNIYDLIQPYPNKPSLDVTQFMIAQGYTPERMFRLSDNFFQSLNLSAMPPEFWARSIIEKPQGREMVCHASAWDFCNGVDFRIKQCTDVNMDYLVTTHHEMGHVQYFIQYKDQPLIFREGANPGFHEAVGDVLALSVSTPRHLKNIGLLDEIVIDRESDINFLMLMALDKVVFLPFGYLMDSWRWDVFSGDSDPDEWNCDWWDYRYEIQGVRPPSKRSSNDFDPGAKFHVPANVPYVRYFVAFILQFQFHKALCLKAGQYSKFDPALPLHHCNIYQSTEAGNALGDMLKLGASKPWPDALEALTGSREMDASILREYFSPLEEWLKLDNQRHGEYIGWQEDEFRVISKFVDFTDDSDIKIVEVDDEEERA